LHRDPTDLDGRARLVDGLDEALEALAEPPASRFGVQRLRVALAEQVLDLREQLCIVGGARSP
jgi:hypothetical protein